MRALTLRCLSGLVSVLLSSGVWAVTVEVAVQMPSGGPVEEAVVFLDSADALRKAKPLTGAEVEQSGKAFVPDVLVVTTGTAVSFPNRDTVRHHVYSFSPTKRFELKLYSGTPANPVVFDKSGVAVLGCNIHDHMIAWVVVVDTPYFGRSASNGRVRLEGVPAGAYTLRVWHKRLPVGAPAQSQSVQLSEGVQSFSVRLEGMQP